MPDENLTPVQIRIANIRAGTAALATLLSQCPPHPHPPSWRSPRGGVVGYSIDPFGPGRLLPALARAANWSSLLINRIHYAEKRSAIAHHGLQFMWNGVPTALLYDHYSAPEGFDFEQKDIYFDPWEVDPHAPNSRRMSKAVAGKAAALARLVLARIHAYPGNDVLIMYGDDFRYASNNRNYEIMDQILALLHANADAIPFTIGYSTLPNYTASFSSLDPSSLPPAPPLRLVYADKMGEYWSGYYTTRVPLKSRIASAWRLLANVNTLATLVDPHILIASSSRLSLISQARRAAALLSHHDAITGTSRPDVVQFYTLTADAIIHLLTPLAASLSASLLTGPLTGLPTPPNDRPFSSLSYIPPTSPPLPHRSFPLLVTNTLPTPRASSISIPIHYSPLPTFAQATIATSSSPSPSPSPSPSSIPIQISPSTSQLLLHIPHIPPLSTLTLNIITSDAPPANSQPCQPPATYNPSTGALSSLRNTPLTLSFAAFYAPRSGAYLFLPHLGYSYLFFAGSTYLILSFLLLCGPFLARKLCLSRVAASYHSSRAAASKKSDAPTRHFLPRHATTSSSYLYFITALAGLVLGPSLLISTTFLDPYASWAPLFGPMIGMAMFATLLYALVRHSRRRPMSMPMRFTFLLTLALSATLGVSYAVSNHPMLFAYTLPPPPAGSAQAPTIERGPVATIISRTPAQGVASTLTLWCHPSDGYDASLQVHVDPLPDMEVFVSFRSPSAGSQRAVYTDTGLAFTRNEFSPAVLMSGNVFPTATGSIISSSSLQVALSRPGGASSLAPNSLQVFLHRSPTRDDMRGLGDHANDNDVASSTLEFTPTTGSLSQARSRALAAYSPPLTFFLPLNHPSLSQTPTQQQRYPPLPDSLILLSLESQALPPRLVRSATFGVRAKDEGGTPIPVSTTRSLAAAYLGLAPDQLTRTWLDYEDIDPSVPSPYIRDENHLFPMDIITWISSTVE